MTNPSGIAELEEARREIDRLRRELVETNRGVVAMVAELDDAAQQWQSTFDAITDGVVVLDSRQHIVRANASFSHLASETGAITGAPAADVFTALFGDSDWLGDPSQGSGGSPVAERASGGRWYEVRVFAVGPGDRQPGRVVVVSDATERRRLVEAERARAVREQEAIRLRERAERMAQLDKVKSEFLQLASHELRGPVGIMRGYLSMLADGSLGTIPGPMAEILPILESKAQEMHMLVEQLLETARLEDSRLLLKRQRVDVREMVREAVAALRVTRKGADIQLDESRATEALTVFADGTRIVTVVANLLDNAVKYSDGRGEVRCTVARQGDAATVEVQDQGIGIADQDAARLFTRFGRIVTPENSHIQGTGLGLYLARELARMHGGDIACESTPGRGSCFTLTLPLA